VRYGWPEMMRKQRAQLGCCVPVQWMARPVDGGWSPALRGTAEAPPPAAATGLPLTVVVHLPPREALVQRRLALQRRPRLAQPVGGGLQSSVGSGMKQGGVC
jgi:hypothetical protein